MVSAPMVVESADALVTPSARAIARKAKVRAKAAAWTAAEAAAESEAAQQHHDDEDDCALLEDNASSDAEIPCLEANDSDSDSGSEPELEYNEAIDDSDSGSDPELEYNEAIDDDEGPTLEANTCVPPLRPHTIERTWCSASGLGSGLCGLPTQPWTLPADPMAQPEALRTAEALEGRPSRSMTRYTRHGRRRAGKNQSAVAESSHNRMSGRGGSSRCTGCGSDGGVGSEAGGHSIDRPVGQVEVNASCAAFAGELTTIGRTGGRQHKERGDRLIYQLAARLAADPPRRPYHECVVAANARP
eukprot:CAMPEP_0174723882 /NCGR_PEP_ID=MMETSP1094-20130205/42139_1 /TAXON_ID=156173 /ORGANISM="Chrysochromulina brevifilum, Strain UTEX LB 985" /LENGTH=301 /DNA_ID=CAMNT_0015925003 /DNA_START=20 /DNA_END=925 /DNA_ORIENTATION=-